MDRKYIFEDRERNDRYNDTYRVKYKFGQPVGVEFSLSVKYDTTQKIVVDFDLGRLSKVRGISLDEAKDLVDDLLDSVYTHAIWFSKP